MKQFFFGHLPQKIFAVVAACAIWVYVNTSITTQKVFQKMPIRVVNLPPDRTIRGLMPNGLLEKRLTVTLVGKKELLDVLNRDDFEIVIDAADKGDEWIVKLDRRNLTPINPDIDFFHSVTKLEHNEFIMKLSKLVTERVNVFFRQPKGEAPEGYQFLDIFPQRITHTVTGPEEDVRKLQEEGLELTLDLNNVTKEELDDLTSAEMEGTDEVSFLIPDSWKKVSIPFLGGMKQEINSPEAKQLRIDFLRKELIPLERDIPIWVYYPPEATKRLNPQVYPLKLSRWVVLRDDLTFIRRPLFAGNVNRDFVDIVRDRLQIVVTADPDGKSTLHWEVDFVDPRQLEERYVKRLLLTGKVNDKSSNMPVVSTQSSSYRMHMQLRERFLRNRFREYMQRFQLFDDEGKPLDLKIIQTDDGITVE